MGGRYWITGAQLGTIKALAGSEQVQKILEQIEEEQFIGNRARVWSCGHKVKPVFFRNEPFQAIIAVEYTENNPEKLCFECWRKKADGNENVP